MFFIRIPKNSLKRIRTSIQGIVLWHIPSKKDIKNLKEYVTLIRKGILFIGKSGLSDIRKEAEKAKLFKLVVGSFDTTKIKSCFGLDKAPWTLIAFTTVFRVSQKKLR